MSDDTDAPSAALTARLGGALDAARRRLRAGMDLLEDLEASRPTEVLAPAIEKTVRALLVEVAEPAHAHRLQDILAGLAQSGMSAGFEADPRARLLFDLADTLEQRHGRRRVLQIIVEHAVVYQQDLLAALLEAVHGPQDPAEVTGQPRADFRDRAGSRLLDLLCSLASLERRDEPPARRAEQVEYYQQSPIDDRFRPLARMAVGEPAAFDDSQPDSADRSGFIRRAWRQIRGDDATALGPLLSSWNDPASRFVTTSYLLFVQSYLVRALIEDLPQMLTLVADLERRGVDEFDDPIDVDQSHDQDG